MKEKVVKQKNIKIPREHPLLNNLVACLFCVFVIVPVCVQLISNVADNKAEEAAQKTEETIGKIVEYTVTTDSSGEALSFNTTIVFEVSNQYYTKVFKTRYFIAEQNEYVKMYYAKGNPFSADVVKVNKVMDNETKSKLYSVLSIALIIFFCIKGYKEIGEARDRRRLFAQQQVLMQNISNINNFNNKSNNMF